MSDDLFDVLPPATRPVGSSASDLDPELRQRSGRGELTHPEFKTCTNKTCGEYLVWQVWTSEGGTKCKAWRCPTRSMGHTTEFV